MIVIDIESTGLDPERHEILELGAVRLDEHGAITDRLRVAIDPLPGERERADPRALEVNRYLERRAAGEWRDAVPVKQALESLRAFVRELEPVASWHAAFDLSWLDVLERRYGFDPLSCYGYLRAIDLPSFAMAALGIDAPPSLRGAAEALSVALPADLRRHTALGDAEAAALVLHAARRLLLAAHDQAVLRQHESDKLERDLKRARAERLAIASALAALARTIRRPSPAATCAEVLEAAIAADDALDSLGVRESIASREPISPRAPDPPCGECATAPATWRPRRERPAMGFCRVHGWREKEEAGT